MNKDIFIRKLAEYLVGNQAAMSILLETQKPEAIQWAELRSTTPLIGYPTIEEAEEQLKKFLSNESDYEQLIYLPLLSWKYPPFRLLLWDTKQKQNGKYKLAYQFSVKHKLVFFGNDFYCSPMHAIDSPQCVAALLSFFALRPGDTDREYFENYTQAQLDFANEYGEELNMIVTEMEEKQDYVGKVKNEND